ncbi:chemotaxis protein CheB [Coralloluteibacterium thermophilus]|uniref:Chemotaxis protein CheB n=1 Tax=Coralloluteibacterium thermophilum TaxID=2707049 RepID=A0ABV9NN86_9GAMM
MDKALPRVVLLGRPGQARDQLRLALVENGVEPVAEGDPNDLDPAGVAALRPQVLLIGLEPAIEDALDRFEALVDDPAIEVVFDDVEVTGGLSGWERARWVRHLLAKLGGHDDVLPPPPEGAEPLPNFDAYAERIPVAGLGVDASAPSAPEPAPAPAPAPEPQRPAPSPAPQAVPQPIPPPAAAAVEAPGPAGLVLEDEGAGLEALSLDGLDPADLAALAEMDAAAAGGDAGGDDAGVVEYAFTSLDLEDDPARLDAAGTGEGIDLMLADFGEDEVVIAADPDEHGTAGFASAAPETAREVPMLDGIESVPSAPARAAADDRFDFSRLELAPLDEEAAPVEPRAEAAPRDLDTYILSDLSLVPTDEPEADAAAETAVVAPATADGAVHGAGCIVLVAGLGGPDAARQFLAALPERLAVPVLLAQHLDAGRHDRLVTQLAKASRLPVYLVQPGQAALAGQVGVLGDGLAVGVDGDRVVFRPGVSDIGALAGLPGSVCVLLSGADPAAVAPALAAAARGGLALAQDPSTCFDASAAEALVAGGATVGAPAELAARAVAHLHGAGA